LGLGTGDLDWRLGLLNDLAMGIGKDLMGHDFGLIQKDVRITVFITSEAEGKLF